MCWEYQQAALSPLLKAKTGISLMYCDACQSHHYGSNLHFVGLRTIWFTPVFCLTHVWGLSSVEMNACKCLYPTVCWVSQCGNHFVFSKLRSAPTLLQMWSVVGNGYQELANCSQCSSWRTWTELHDLYQHLTIDKRIMYFSCYNQCFFKYAWGPSAWEWCGPLSKHADSRRP